MKDNVARYKARRKARLKRRHFFLPFDKVSYYLYFMLFERNCKARHASVNAGQERVLVIAPHQDDEMLGCGGFMIGCRGKAEVQIVFVVDTKGPAWLRTEEERNGLSKTRIAEGRDVAGALEVNEPIFLGLEEASLNESANLAKRFSEEIEKFNPTAIMAPFFTDSHKEHLLITQGLARVQRDLCERISIVLYRTHAQIPRRFVNRYYGLSDIIHREKEDILKLYKSQKLDVDITREKYLLYSKLLPGNLKGNYNSIERFCCLDFQNFIELEQQHRDDALVGRVKGINYAPYSFIRFFFNELLFRFSQFCRNGSIDPDT